MSISYSSFCDDLFVDMYINTRLDLPSDRDILLSYFERITKQFPEMTSLAKESTGYCLEESNSLGKSRWASVDIDRLGAGLLNPDSFEQAFELPNLIIGLIPYMLGVRSLDVECVDLVLGMDFECGGNHNEIISEALFAGSAFAKAFDCQGAGPLGLSPAVVIALDNDCNTRARITVDSRTDEDEIKRRKFDKNKPISLHLTMRQYPVAGKKFDIKNEFDKLGSLANEFMDEKVLPNFVMPLTNAIAHRR